MEGSLQTSSESPAAVPPASHCNSNLCCSSSSSSSSVDEAPSHFLAPNKASQPEAGRSRPSSARGFLRGKFPCFRRRERGSPVPLGQAACRSRLCMEATHESPIIPAVRKPAARGEALGWDPDKDSLGGRPGPSLLSKLLCLRATSSQLHKPPWGQRPLPLHRACARCGPVAALSRTADPQGESPLRWKPSAASPHPAEARPGAEPQRRAAVAGLAGSCVARPWRVLRRTFASTAKKGALPRRQRERNPHPPHGAAREESLGLAAEPGSSPASRASGGFVAPQSCTAAVEDARPPAAFPHDQGEPSGEAGGHRLPPQGLRSQGSPSEESGPQEESLAPEGASAQGGPQTQVGDVRGGSAEEGATEGSGGGRGGYWVEVGDGEEEDLADLAENPGGQGMVMATRDLGWLSSELLGGPGRRLGGQKRGSSTDSNPEAAPGPQGEDAAWAESSPERAHTQAVVLGPATAQADGAPVGQPRGVGTAPTSRAHPLGDAGAPVRGSLREADPARSLEPWALPLPARGPPSLNHGLLVPVDPAGENRLGQGSAPRLASAEEQKKQLLYRAAVEIVGAAVDAAAAQVAKKEEQERAKR